MRRVPRTLGLLACVVSGPAPKLSPMATTHVELDRQRIKELTEREEKRLNERTQASQRMSDSDAGVSIE